MICIPITGDQPFVSYRVANELGLGVRLDSNHRSRTNIRYSVHKILSDKFYYERSERYSAFSRKHVGYLNGSKLILDLIAKPSTSNLYGLGFCFSCRH